MAEARPAPDARPDLVVFAHLLRAVGVAVGSHQVVAFAEAADALAPLDAADLYWAGRATLVVHPSDIAAYDRVFRAWFQGEDPGTAHVTVEDMRDDALPPELRPLPAEPAATDDDRDDRDEVAGAIASAVDVLRHRRFDRATDDELRAIRSLMSGIVVAVPHRTVRRTRSVPRGRVPDLRRTVHHAITTDGELLRRAWRRRRTRPRRLVLLLDVSGSMAGYSRALLQFAFSARVTTRDVEVFCFGTRLTRLTEELGERDVDAAVAAAAARVVDWDGGTRIGDSLATLNRTYGRRGLLRGAIVVICSDGLERGDPELLGAEVARISRYAHRLVWVNPLKADERYEPLARGMAAALPHVDRFVTGHDLASLDALADVLAAL